MSDVKEYGVEGVMTNAGGGWLLALDRRFEAEAHTRLSVQGWEPSVETEVVAVLESDDGATRDIIIAPIPELYDPRLLVGRTLVTA